MTIREADLRVETTALPALSVGDRGAVVGPNAIIRVAEALGTMEGEGVRRAVFAEAGLSHRLREPPTDMVDEQEVARLQLALHDVLGPHRSLDVAREAGRLTALYLLAHRIPRLAQIALRLAPKRLAARLMAGAIARHSWTFAGSGAFSFVIGQGIDLVIRGGPVCRLIEAEEPACAYYAATFEGVFGAVLGPSVRVVETRCEACGAEACRFELSW